MTKAPLTIDNATVLLVADLRSAAPTGETRHVAEGSAVEGLAALAIVRYQASEGVYLLYCDADWKSITDTYHDDVDGAIEQARFEFGPIDFVEA
jgi:hypothetical protein